MTEVGSLALIIVIGMILVGGFLGIATAALVLRSRLRLTTALKAGALSSTTCLIDKLVGGWAESIMFFENGTRLDTAPWGQDLRARNWIADHQLLIMSASSVLVAFIYSRWHTRE